MAKSRYSSLDKIIDGKDFNKRYESFPNITSNDIKSNNDTFITWDETQRLDNIANDYLGDGRYWWVICLMNDLKFPFGELQNGQILRIPSSIDYVFNAIRNKKR